MTYITPITQIGRKSVKRKHPDIIFLDIVSPTILNEILPHTVPVSRGMCKQDDCKKLARYGITGKKEYCKEHAPKNAYDRTKRCDYSDCKKYAGRKFGGKKYCSTHAPINSVRISNKCSHQDCQKFAGYKFKNNRYCAEHAPFDAELLNKCRYPDCKKYASHVSHNKNGSVRLCHEHFIQVRS